MSRSKDYRCPHCGEILHQPEWIDTAKFIAWLNPTKVMAAGGDQWQIMGRIPSQKALDALRKARGRNLKMKGHTAEKILQELGLDTHIPDEIRVQD